MARRGRGSLCSGFIGLIVGVSIWLAKSDYSVGTRVGIAFGIVLGAPLALVVCMASIVFCIKHARLRHQSPLPTMMTTTTITTTIPGALGTAIPQPQSLSYNPDPAAFNGGDPSAMKSNPVSGQPPMFVAPAVPVAAPATPALPAGAPIPCFSTDVDVLKKAGNTGESAAFINALHMYSQFYKADSNRTYGYTLPADAVPVLTRQLQEVRSAHPEMWALPVVQDAFRDMIVALKDAAARQGEGGAPAGAAASSASAEENPSSTV